jgi:hypothetical protein
MHQLAYVDSLGAEFEELAEVVLFQSVPLPGGGTFTPDVCLRDAPFNVCRDDRFVGTVTTPIAKGGQSKGSSSSSSGK